MSISYNKTVEHCLEVMTVRWERQLIGHLRFGNFSANLEQLHTLCNTVMILSGGLKRPVDMKIIIDIWIE